MFLHEKQATEIAIEEAEQQKEAEKSANQNQEKMSLEALSVMVSDLLSENEDDKEQEVAEAGTVVAAADGTAAALRHVNVN